MSAALRAYAAREMSSRVEQQQSEEADADAAEGELEAATADLKEHLANGAKTKVGYKQRKDE